MNQQRKTFQFSFSTLSSLLLIISGGIFALYYLLFETKPYRTIESATFLDTVKIPFDWVQIGPISFPITLDNFLVFQEYFSLASPTLPLEAKLFAAVVFLVAVSFLSVLSDFKKLAIVAGGIGWIVLLTVCNFNGLNIGGPSANIPLIILLIGSLAPVICFHIWGQNLPFWIKWISNALSLGLAVFFLVQLSPIENPGIYLAEHATILAFGFAVAWIFWNGHSVVSGSYILLARSNRKIGVKIAWQVAIISLGYLTILFLLFMEMMGDIVNPVFGFSPLLLIIPLGAFGWFSLDSKTKQIPNLAASPQILKALHLLGLGLTLWLVYKLVITGNQPAEELLKHVLLYSQIGFSLFFIVYLFSNFLSIMDSGKAIDEILYKPYSLPYYHLRIGGLMAILVLTIYAEGVIATQANAMTNNILADYFYQTDQKLEASILYENSWFKYRKNEKAKNLTAQLLFQINQPTLAKQHLEESFAEYPQVDNILLLSNRLHRENKVIESIFYLERGLSFFPKNPYLANNLALFYTKVNKLTEAIQVLEENTSGKDVLYSNLLALKTKLGNPEADSTISNQIIDQINQLATNNSLANYSPDDLKSDLKEKLENKASPMLIHAGFRNLFSEKDRQDPSSDLAILDSLGMREDMVDYIMDLQETAVIRSLGAGRVMESVKNLNGLAFRNPGSAGYYLSLSSQILAQNLDFKKSARELLVAEEKGFKAFQPHHISILTLAGFVENANEISAKYEVIYPSFLRDEDGLISDYLQIVARFHEYFPEDLFDIWTAFPESELKTDLAIRILTYKSHGIEKHHLTILAENLRARIGETPELDKFLSNPDWQNKEALGSFLSWLNLSEELTANPYITPLILSAAERVSDPLAQYELLNEASQFNRDPLLWIRKIQAAKRINLDSYANDALKEMKEWIPEAKLDSLKY